MPADGSPGNGATSVATGDVSFTMGQAAEASGDGGPAGMMGDSGATAAMGEGAVTVKVQDGDAAALAVTAPGEGGAVLSAVGDTATPGTGGPVPSGN